MHSDLALKLTADLFWTGLLVCLPVLGVTVLVLPPTTIALPLKILVFVLVDGWALVLKALAGSFH